MKPKILITNDDGIFAPGIKALWQALAPHAQITIVAPMTDQSGTGVGVSFRTPLQTEQVTWEEGTTAWKVNGTPADCVKLSLRVLMKEKPDLIVSGINRGSNSGRTVLYSGTVGGVIEGAMRHIPGIAFSCEEFNNPNYQAASNYIYPLVKYVLEHPLPGGTLLNVNFPASTPSPKGVRLARQGRGYWVENPDERIHPEGNPYYWLGGRWDHHEEAEDSDVFLLKEGYVAVVPIHVSELTDHHQYESRKTTFNELFSS